MIGSGVRAERRHTQAATVSNMLASPGRSFCRSWPALASAASRQLNSCEMQVRHAFCPETAWIWTSSFRSCLPAPATPQNTALAVLMSNVQQHLIVQDLRLHE